MSGTARYEVPSTVTRSRVCIALLMGCGVVFFAALAVLADQSPRRSRIALLIVGASCGVACYFWVHAWLLGQNAIEIDDRAIRMTRDGVTKAEIAWDNLRGFRSRTARPGPFMDVRSRNSAEVVRIDFAVEDLTALLTFLADRARERIPGEPLPAHVRGEKRVFVLVVGAMSSSVLLAAGASSLGGRGPQIIELAAGITGLSITLLAVVFLPYEAVVDSLGIALRSRARSERIQFSQVRGIEIFVIPRAGTPDVRLVLSDGDKRAIPHFGRELIPWFNLLRQASLTRGSSRLN